MIKNFLKIFLFFYKKLAWYYNILYLYIIIIKQILTKMKNLKFKNTAKGQKAKAIAKNMGNASELAIIEELRLRGYSNHFTTELYA